MNNLDIKRTEMNNIIEDHPKIAQELEQMWKTWANRIAVLTWEKSEEIN